MMLPTFFVESNAWWSFYGWITREGRLGWEREQLSDNLNGIRLMFDWFESVWIILTKEIYFPFFCFDIFV